MSKTIVRDQWRPVKPPERRELEEFVRMVLRTMKGRGELHGDEQDAFQWGALAVWEGALLRCVPLVEGNRVYHFRAARLKILYQQKRAQVAASVYDRFARGARIGWDGIAGQPKAPGERLVDVPGGASPAARIEGADRRRARADLVAAVHRHIDAEAPRTRKALKIATRRESDTPIADAAWLTGSTVLELNAAVARVRKRVHGDRSAMRKARIAAELAA